MVLTFESTPTPVGTTLRLIDQHESMQAASAQLPDGAYTTFRTYAGNRILRLKQHITRLETSAALLGQTGNLDEPALTAAIGQALRQARASAGWSAPEARFRLTFAPPRAFISIEPFTPYPAGLYETGVACATVTLQRSNPQAKSTSFIAPAAQAYQALPAGTHEGLMVAGDGSVLEGLSSNFFAIHHNTLCTENVRVLHGVTRSLVLEVAAPVLTLSTRAVTVHELPHIDECFITSVSREILPVVRIDDFTIGSGRPGPVTQTLMAAFAALIDREALPLP
jgi:branched-chain amino acid aminotransferase